MKDIHYYSISICYYKNSLNRSWNPSDSGEKKWYEIDWKRNLVFTLFGAIYLGVQYAMYVEGFKRLFPAMERFCNLSFRAKLKDREGIKSLLQQIGLDFVVIQPVLYWPAFYLCKEYVIRITENIEETGNNLFIGAMNRYKNCY